MKSRDLKARMTAKGLRVTSRRISILEAIIELHHPTAEEIIRLIRKKYPATATATVYKALNILVEKEVISRVNTDKDIYRYDAILDPHHHLYSSEISRIEDYNDEVLSGIVREYFEKKRIPGFRVEDIKIQILGKFTDQTGK